MGGLPISQAAIDLGLRDIRADQLRDEAERKKKPKGLGERTPSLADKIMGGAATDLFGGGF